MVGMPLEADNVALLAGGPLLDGGPLVAGGPQDEFDQGAAGPLEDFYDPALVKSLSRHLISVEPPMWVIDAPLSEGPNGDLERAEGDEASDWMWPFVDFVEEQAGQDATWEAFNVKNALHTPPERCWIVGSSPDGQPAEKLSGLQAFLRRASGSGKTFLDKGRPFAVKRYPFSGVPENAETVEHDGDTFYPAENLHIDRLQRDADLPKLEAGEAKLYGDPTHFTLVVGLDGGAGGTFFPHGRLLPDLQALPDGVSQGQQGGVLVQSRRGRALLWSNHRGSTDSAGRVVPLHSSLHQSVLKASQQDAGARRVCIFGWAEEGRKWERCGFHECLEYEEPEFRAKFFHRTLLEELKGWAGGLRDHEVARHLRSAEAQKEMTEMFEKGTVDEETRNWLAEYGYTSVSEIYQLMVVRLENGQFDWVFLTVAGNKKWSFRYKERSMKVSELVKRTKESYNAQIGQRITTLEVLDHHTQKKVENMSQLVQQGQQYIIAIRSAAEPKEKVGAPHTSSILGGFMTRSISAEGGFAPPPRRQASTISLDNNSRTAQGSGSASSSSGAAAPRPVPRRSASEQWTGVEHHIRANEDKTIIQRTSTFLKRMFSLSSTGSAR